MNECIEPSSHVRTVPPPAHSSTSSTTTPIITITITITTTTTTKGISCSGGKEAYWPKRKIEKSNSNGKVSYFLPEVEVEEQLSQKKKHERPQPFVFLLCVLTQDRSSFTMRSTVCIVAKDTTLRNQQQQQQQQHQTAK